MILLVFYRVDYKQKQAWWRKVPIPGPAVTASQNGFSIPQEITTLTTYFL